MFLIFMFSTPSFAITIKQEEDIAREFIDKVRTYYPIIDDSEIADYVTDLGEKILKGYPEQLFKYHFYVIKDDVFNAFAGPGGHVFINSGLFAALESEEELAGIIGHEISHVTCRHISERIERAGKIGLSTIAGVAAGIFLGIYGDPAAGSALTIGSIAGGQSLSLAYSRENEMQADNIGLQYLNKAGYSGQGLIDSLNKIRSRQWFGKDQIPVYLTTHPALEDRMSYIANWVNINEKGKTGFVKNSFDFKMAHTKILAEYTNLAKAEQLFKTKLEKSANDLFANYGYGVVLARSGKYEMAVKYLKKSLEKKAFHTGMLKTLGRVYYEGGDYEKARNVFEGIISILPIDFEANLYYSQSLTELGFLDEAMAVITPFTSEENGKTRAYFCIADIYSRKNLPGDSYFYLGHYYKGKKDIENAKLQFKRALLNTRDDVKRQKIKTQIDKLNPKKAEKKKTDKKE